MAKEMDKSAKGRNVVSIILTLLVVGIYLVPNFAEAVSVSISTDKNEYTIADTTIATDLSVTIRETERLPIQDISLLLNGSEICKFNVDGSKITACTGITITQTSAGNFGSAILNGTDEDTSVFTQFGYGYGLENGHTGTLAYNVTIARSTVATGAYALSLSVNAVGSVNSHVYSGETTFSVGNDNLAGDADDVDTNIPGLALDIGGSTDLGQQFTGVLPVNFSDGTDTIVEFEWDFSDTSSSLSLSDVIINEEVIDGSNTIVISGIDLTSLGVTKTAYLDQTNATLTRVCIRDEEILSISEMTNDCSDSSEVEVECNGIAQSGFTCTDLGTRLKIEGLEHSGIAQQGLSEKTISLDSGVSMFSLPLQPVSPVTFNDIQSGCTFNSDPVKNPNFPNGISYRNPDTETEVYLDGDAILHPGQGYFVTLQSACQFTIEGYTFTAEDIGFLGTGNLKTGWNTIGAPTEQVSNFDTIEGTCNVVSGPWGFDAASYSYVRTQILVPGEGYYVKTTNVCSLG